MTSALQVYEKPDDVRKDLQAMAAQVAEVLPGKVDPDRFLRVVAKAVIENPRLMACTRISLLSAIHEAAQLGLEPSGLLGSAYLVPYRRRVQVNGQWQTYMEAQLIPGYRGLIDLARRSGDIQGIYAEVVRKRDHFRRVQGTEPRLEHEPFVPDPSAPPEERDRGPIVGVYMVATLGSGLKQTEWMTYDEVEAVRKRSKAADDGPWITDYSEMARKTVVRRGSKYLPLSTEFRRGLELDEEAEQREAVQVEVNAKPSRAAQMLLDRAGATALVPDMERLESQPAQDDPGAPPAPEVGPDPTQEPSDQPEPVPGATEVCGDESPDLGICDRAPNHPGGHRNAQGVWPRAKAQK